MSGSPADRIVALAGLFQATALVDTLATTGRADQRPFATSIGSIYSLEADSVAECYPGGAESLELGRTALRQALAGERDSKRYLRYAFTLMALERKLAGQPELLEVISSRVRSIETQVVHLGPAHEQIVGRLADLYVDTVSTLRPRVLVQGTPLYLQQERIVAGVRALLLSGMRSAVLWRQLGGSRWQFLWGRAGMRRALDAWEQAIA